MQKMLVKNIIDEDFSNYKECAMFIGFPNCTFKCEKDCGLRGICQNSALATSDSVEVSYQSIVSRYFNNPLSKAIVFGGLEPFDNYDDVCELVVYIRQQTDDPIIIYTGYTKDEIINKVNWLSLYKNIIIKFGRFVPNQEKHFDEVLGVFLASDNQYAERIS